MWAGEDDTQRFKTRVLKPPGGGSSDIFGTASEEMSPRRVRTHNQSQLGSALFGDANGTDGGGNGSSVAMSSRTTSKPGNDSYKRLFGPPDAPPVTPNARNHMRSSIPISGGSTPSSVSSLSSGAATSPAKSTASSGGGGIIVNGYAAINGGNNWTNDITDGNPITGTGYASPPQKNGPILQNGTVSPSSSSGEKSSVDSSPAAAKPARTRVPPGGYSSGLW